MGLVALSLMGLVAPFQAAQWGSALLVTCRHVEVTRQDTPLRGHRVHITASIGGSRHGQEQGQAERG